MIENIHNFKIINIKIYIYIRKCYLKASALLAKIKNLRLLVILRENRYRKKRKKKKVGGKERMVNRQPYITMLLF